MKKLNFFNFHFFGTYFKLLFFRFFFVQDKARFDKNGFEGGIACCAI